MKVTLHKYLRWATLPLAGIIMFLAAFMLDRWYQDMTVMPNRARAVGNYIEKNVAAYNRLGDDSVFVNKLIQDRLTYEELQKIRDLPFHIFLYKETPAEHFLKFWNTSKVLPDVNTLSGPYGRYFLKLPNGYYYVIKKPVPWNTAYTMYGLLLVKYSFFIETNSLIDQFAFSDNLHKTVDVSIAPTPYPVLVNGEKAFYIKQKQAMEVRNSTITALVLKLVGLFLFFLGLFFIIQRKNKLNSVNEALVFTGLILVYRYLIFFARGMMAYKNFDLFDPTIYASSYLLPSLGDLLIGSLLFCWIAVFAWDRLKDKSVFKKISTPLHRQLVGLLLIISLVVATFVNIDVIRGMIANSKISFDVTNFFSLNVYTAVGFFILACLSIGYYFFSRLMYKIIFAAFAYNKYLVYILTGAVALAYYLVLSRYKYVDYALATLVWLMLCTLYFQHERKIAALIRFNVSGMIVWIFTFSVVITALMIDEVREAELEQRKVYMEKLSTLSDPANERLVEVASKNLTNDFFKKNLYRFAKDSDNAMLKDSISAKNFAGYNNLYSTDIYLYDSAGNAINNKNKFSLATLTNIIQRQSRQTAVQDLYYYESAIDKYAYIIHRAITGDSGRNLGQVFIISNPRQFAETTMKPELFRDYNQDNISNYSMYQYAVYNNGVLLSSSNKYPFATVLGEAELPAYRYELRNNGGYSELWYRPTPAKVILMVRKSQRMLEVITLFSYIFCSFLLLLALMNVVSMIVASYMSTTAAQRPMFHLSIRGQIHATFILITVLSFLIVGVATISFFIERFQAANNERLSRTMGIIGKELQNRPGFLASIYDLSGKNDTVKVAQLDSLIKSVSEVQGIDINIYDLTGKLRATSQPDVYNRGVLSTQMGPRVYYNLANFKKVEAIQNDKISNLNYKSIYAPIRDRKGTPYGFIGIPFFSSQQDVNQEISTFLITLINLNAFIFLITGLIALLIANRVTRSFKLVGDKMRKINLSGKNESISWINSDDEIGTLVKEYNKMVLKLEASASSLAKEEREVAWREMARQVAHEIKNPLTPMKLSLQYLQKAINEDNPNVQRLTKSVANNLVEQIEHLSKIASDFAQFANINKVDNHIFDLHEVLSSVISLFEADAKVSITWNRQPGEVLILADKTQMNRLFTNLLTNAVEATAVFEKPVIEVIEKIKGGQVTIKIKDNGTGIPTDMRAKIFTPNFTTKTSGTGLGLAMCKTIVENSGGEIWFETAIQNGTVFYVKMPLAGY